MFRIRSREWGRLRMKFFPCRSRCTFVVLAVVVGIFLNDRHEAGAAPLPENLGLGRSHSCAVMDDGSVRCWGSNESGQLGDGTTIGRLTPVEVSGITSDTVAVTGGDRHTCSTGLQGTRCWGDNSNGQLGTGTTVSATTPQTISVGGSTGPLTSISAGGVHTCAIFGSGTYCWGDNSQGQLGIGSTSAAPSPTFISGVSSGVPTKIAAGLAHTCVVASSGAVRCWGDNTFGQIGDGSNSDRLSPVTVVFSSAADIAAGSFHSCARVGSAVRCWGRNSRGQLGTGTTSNSSAPITVSGISQAVSEVVAGGEHTCVLLPDGTVRCWGANDKGQLGTGDTIDKTSQVVLSDITGGVAHIEAGEKHTCAVFSSGAMKCWGDNSLGTLGDNTTDDRLVPTDVVFDPPTPTPTSTPTSTPTPTPTPTATIEVPTPAPSPSATPDVPPTAVPTATHTPLVVGPQEIRGRVNPPVEGATVYLNETPDPGGAGISADRPAVPVASTLTDALGEYRFVVEVGKTYVISPVFTGVTFEPPTVTATGGQEAPTFNAVVTDLNDAGCTRSTVSASINSSNRTVSRLFTVGLNATRRLSRLGEGRTALVQQASRISARLQTSRGVILSQSQQFPTVNLSCPTSRTDCRNDRFRAVRRSVRRGLNQLRRDTLLAARRIREEFPRQERAAQLVSARVRARHAAALRALATVPKSYTVCR